MVLFKDVSSKMATEEETSAVHFQTRHLKGLILLTEQTSRQYSPMLKDQGVDVFETVVGENE